MHKFKVGDELLFTKSGVKVTIDEIIESHDGSDPSEPWYFAVKDNGVVLLVTDGGLKCQHPIHRVELGKCLQCGAGGDTEDEPNCKHPPEKLYSWFAYNHETGKNDFRCVGCKQCGEILRGRAGLEARNA